MNTKVQYFAVSWVKEGYLISALSRDGLDYRIYPSIREGLYHITTRCLSEGVLPHFVTFHSPDTEKFKFLLFDVREVNREDRALFFVECVSIKTRFRVWQHLRNKTKKILGILLEKPESSFNMCEEEVCF